MWKKQYFIQKLETKVAIIYYVNTNRIKKELNVKKQTLFRSAALDK